MRGTKTGSAIRYFYKKSSLLRPVPTRKYRGRYALATVSCRCGSYAETHAHPKDAFHHGTVFSPRDGLFATGRSFRHGTVTFVSLERPRGSDIDHVERQGLVVCAGGQGRDASCGRKLIRAQTALLKRCCPHKSWRLLLWGAWAAGTGVAPNPPHVIITVSPITLALLITRRLTERSLLVSDDP